MRVNYFTVRMLMLLVCWQQATCLKISIHERGFNYAADVLISRYSKTLIGKPLIDLEEEKEGLRYKLTNVKITNFMKPTFDINLKEGTSTIAVYLGNGNFEISTNWNYRYRKNRFIRFSDSGSTIVSIINAAISVDFDFQLDLNTRKPKVDVVRCDASFGDINFNFRGIKGWIYSLLTRFLSSSIENSLKKTLCDVVVTTVDKVNQNFASLETDISMGNNLFVYYSLTTAPIIRSRAIEFMGASCVYVSGEKQCPQYKHQMQNADPTNKMISISISEESINSYISSLFLSQQLNYYVAKKNFGKDLKILDVDCKKGLCAAALFPNLPDVEEGSLELDCRVTESPKIHISPSAVWSDIILEVVTKFRFANDTLIDVLKTRLELKLNVNITFSDNVLKFWAANMKPNIKFMDDLEENDKERATFAFNLLFNRFRSNVINKKGNEGIPIPKLNKITLEDSVIVLKDRFVIIQSDAKYAEQL
ncbi:hypothetical protein HELRODRAFT_159270 [Helobdella robusta]|uniref:Lipid-binding serum glycoprotein N-terminal domain-containing protein n=1 Tax=Helobdella robusta TaxID=6412 RepID=T1ENT2_HELRO|nr:hypothetical protein HELRODRAFT_159270 [Helobdella robusta]ESO12685.1 hypothetical protein HELRODRAFT_159270 [Helobdella robusta]